MRPSLSLPALFLLFALRPALADADAVRSPQSQDSVPARGRPSFFKAEAPLEFGGLLLGEAVGIGAGALLGAALGPAFADKCEEGDEACHDAWVTPEGAAAIFMGLVGAGVGQAAGIHLAGHLMGKRGYFMLTLLETAAWDAAALGASVVLQGKLDSRPDNSEAAFFAAAGTFLSVASIMPCLTYAWLDYRIRFPVAPRVTLGPGPDGRMAPGLRLDLVQARFP